MLMIRTYLIRALHEGLIGPKNGHKEIIEEPFGTYQIGVLTSCFYPRDLNDKLISDPSEKGLVASGRSHTEQEEFPSDDNSLWPDTELGMDGSFTLGITFTVRGKSPKIRICSTWGRYKPTGTHPKEMKIFRRSTNYYLTDWINVSEDMPQSIKLIPGKNSSVITKDGAEMYIKTKHEHNNSWSVQVFLVNKTPYVQKDNEGNPKRQDETHRMFQPQIRINVDKDSKVGYLGEDDYADDNASSLYYKQRTKARGFQCGALWKEVDPEGYDGESGFKNFLWIDGNSGVLPKEIRSSFTCPDIRTEYLPQYTILQPEINTRSYDADSLSDQWDPVKIKEQLSSLADEYERWIKQQKSYLDSGNNRMPNNLVNDGKRNLDKCSKSLDEIKKGIDFVCSNEHARLAFCFMNRVMANKRRYENKDKHTDVQKLYWREFQMGFILQSLRGVAGLDNGSDIADVLWFPTGGGKTEAYLGIIVFVMAYRRLLDPNGIKDMYGQILNNDGGVNVISRYTLRLLTIQQFHRAIGAVLLSDLLRVQNWIPSRLADGGSANLKDDGLRAKLLSGNLWGGARFSTGLWIGKDATPTRFAYMTGNRGKKIPNAEGSLLSHIVYSHDETNGDPVQVNKCPLCESILAFPTEKPHDTNEFCVSWIVKTKKSTTDLSSVPRSKFDHPYKKVQLCGDPEFTEIKRSDDGHNFIQVKMSLKFHKTAQNLRKTIDDWWHYYVDQIFGSTCRSPSSTCASLPGYFFLQRPGESRPYDFSVYCTNQDCILNNTEWFEQYKEAPASNVPEPFRGRQSNKANSVPISAFTVDEQIYSQCPTLIISTSDKFANLPWDSRCASIFGNVNCRHKFFGYGRQHDFNAPILDRNSTRIIPQPSEFVNSDRFIPPSLIIQDEIHLIEGPLGSMAGVYEMAIDVLGTIGKQRPKYIASSATIANTEKQIRTIFRRNARIFPPRGVYTEDNFFTKSSEDASCVEEKPGRLYVGVCSAKTIFELPIKICAILMSTVHKIKENPEMYGVAKDEVDQQLDPYWTYVSYFTDLLLMSRFSGFYGDDIERDIKKISPYRAGTYPVAGVGTFTKGIRFIPITSEKDFDVYGISVYCHNSKGKILVGLFDSPELNCKPKYSFESHKKCHAGENLFAAQKAIYRARKGETIWVAVANNDPDTVFRTTKPIQSWFEIKNDSDDLSIGHIATEPKKMDVNSIQVELVGKERAINDEGKIEMSSQTKSEDLPKFLERLQKPLSVDVLLTSPVFGTGIDVDRLGLINIMTQPKTTSAYIQATGRVGRQKPALVVTWFVPRRVRDLDHYENFVGYHRKIHSFVEPITANPLSDESLDLSLGPAMVAILRNAYDVSGVRISQEWSDNTSGPASIMKHENGNSCEINSVRNALMKIAQFEDIPEFRKNQEFESILDRKLDDWLDLVRRMRQENRDVIYGERNPTKPVEKDVILGTPFHESRGFSAAFSNTRNSLRDTETTSMFYHDTKIRSPVRPSQFIIKYGSGSFLPSDISITAPSVSDMVANLRNPKGNFTETVDGKNELRKIEIEDRRMLKILHHYNPNMDLGNIKIFSMPTNSSLNSKTHAMADHDTLYRAKLFPQWGVCSRHSGDRILSKIINHPSTKSPVIRCPHCMEQFGDKYSAVFSSARFVVACKNGHMSDVPWDDEIHRSTRCSHSVSSDDKRVFVWNESGGGDNIIFQCYGVWTDSDHEFEETKCNAQTKYSTMRFLSNEGSLRCKGRFVEDDTKSHNCEDSPIIARKSMMSLRSPIVMSSLVVQQRRSRLFDKISPHAEVFCFVMSTKGKEPWEPTDIAAALKESRMSPGLLSDIGNADRRTLQRVNDELLHANDENTRTSTISETESLTAELRSLENGIEEGSKQTRISGGQDGVDVKYPIRWTSKKYGLHFEAMPFSNIRATTVQIGYTREISEIIPDKEPGSELEKAMQTRLGKIVSKSSRYDDESSGVRWYMGDQSNGEGIFIRLDPNKHADNTDIFKTAKNTTLDNWKGFHDRIAASVEEKLQSSNLNLTGEDRDVLEHAKTRSHPLFVWWHTMSHQIISELAIDSGFSTAMLNERIYCENSNGMYSSGILIYVTATGSDGTLGGLTSLADDDILPKIVERSLDRIRTCSNDPICAERTFHMSRHRGAACHSCILVPETTCGYFNKFLDRNLVRDT